MISALFFVVISPPSRRSTAAHLVSVRFPAIKPNRSRTTGNRLQTHSPLTSSRTPAVIFPGLLLRPRRFLLRFPLRFPLRFLLRFLLRFPAEYNCAPP